MNSVNTLILILALSFSLNGSSQQATSENNSWFAVGLGFSQAYFLDKNFTNSFENGFAETTQILNLRFFGPIPENKELYFDFGYYLPQKARIGDSVNYQFSGFYFGLPWQSFRIEHINGEKNNGKLLLSTPIFLGTDMGWMFLKTNKIQQRNFFLNVKLQIEPRLVLFQRLIIGTGLTISYDLTQPEWKGRDIVPVNTKNFRNTTFSVNASLGWVLTSKKKSKSDED